MTITSLPTRAADDLGLAIANTRTPAANELSAVSIEGIKTRIIEIGTEIGLSNGTTPNSLNKRVAAIEGGMVLIAPTAPGVGTSPAGNSPEGSIELNFVSSPAGEPASYVTPYWLFLENTSDSNLSELVCVIGRPSGAKRTLAAPTKFEHSAGPTALYAYAGPAVSAGVKGITPEDFARAAVLPREPAFTPALKTKLDGLGPVTIAQIAAELAANVSVDPINFNGVTLTGVDGPSNAQDVANKTYVDTQITSLATATVPTTRTVTAGAGLTGGGALSANISLACNFGTTPDISAVGTANAAGSKGKPADAGHAHDHGAQTTPTHHALATAAAHGFLSSTDYDRIIGDAKNSEVLFRDEFTGLLDTFLWTAVVSGASSGVVVASPGAGSYGACRLYCGTTSTGTAELSSPGAYFYGPRYSLFRFRTKLMTSALSSATDEYDLFVNYAGANGVSFTYDRNVSANWQRTTWSGGAATNVDTGIPVLAATQYDLTWYWTPAAGGTVEYFINGVSAGSVTGRAFGGVFLSPGRMVKSAGTTSQFAYLDFVEAIGVLATPRP